MLELLITTASRELFALAKPYIGKTDSMTDDDWEKVIAGVNKIVKQSEGTMAYEYAMQYGMLLLNELDREAHPDLWKRNAA